MLKTAARFGLVGVAAYGAYRLAVKYKLVERAVEVVEEVKEHGLALVETVLTAFPFGAAVDDETEDPKDGAVPHDPDLDKLEEALTAPPRTWSDS
jgi:hypothetical protein